MEWRNELTRILKTDYPIIQAPMLGVTTPQMVAAISDQGGLGSLPVGGLSAAKTSELIYATKKLTNNTFAVNLFTHQVPNDTDKSIYSAMQSFLANLAADNNLDLVEKAPENIDLYSYKEQIDILIKENISIVSFTFGILDDESIIRLKNNGVILIGTATCLEEAIILDKKGIDIITAQGIEAGGHRGSFINMHDPPLIGLMSLLPQIADAIRKPIVAAGGIADGRGIKAAFVLGAQGVQIGTAFIASDESAAIASYKASIQNAKDTDIVLTRSITGRWARGLKNELITQIENSQLQVAEFPVQNTLTASLRASAQKQDNKDFISMWAGQSSSKAVSKKASEIFAELIQVAEKC